jgi:hypothetical protein
MVSSFLHSTIDMFTRQETSFFCPTANIFVPLNHHLIILHLLTLEWLHLICYKIMIQ